MSFRLCGGHRVGYRQLLPGKIVVEGDAPLRRRLGGGRSDHAGTDDLPGVQPVQHILKRQRVRVQRGGQLPLRIQDGEGEDDTVRLFHPPQAGL